MIKKENFPNAYKADVDELRDRMRYLKRGEEIDNKTITPNDIGKKVFTGDEAVTGTEYNEGIGIIQRDLKKDTRDRNN